MPALQYHCCRCHFKNSCLPSIAHPAAPDRCLMKCLVATCYVLLLLLQSQGPKRTMEDCNCLAALHPQHGVLSSIPSRGVSVSQQHVAVAAVFDGHAGCQTALTAAEHLPHLLHQGLSGRQGCSTSSEGSCTVTAANWQCSRCIAGQSTVTSR
jgi:hypothetical protein